MRLINPEVLKEELAELRNLDGEFAEFFTNMGGERSIEYDSLDSVIDNTPTAMGWIPYDSKHLPPGEGTYLVWVMHTQDKHLQFQDTADYRVNDEYGFGKWDIINDYVVLAWSPLLPDYKPEEEIDDKQI